MPDPRLDELWQAVLASWSDEAAHAAFLDHCRRTRQLGAAAACYGAYREDATRGETAQKRLGGIAMLVTLDLDAHRAALDDSRATLVVALRVVAVLVLLGLTLFAAVRFLAP